MPAGWAVGRDVEGPGVDAPGPKGYGSNTIYRQIRRFAMSTPRAMDSAGCGDRVSVTGDHLSFDGNLRCPPG